MDEKQQPNEDQQIDKRFLSVLHEVETIKNKYVVEAQLQWYEKRVGLPRFFFNLSGILIILLSVSIPYLATLEGPWRNIVLPIVALMVAGLTGLSSFFRWDTTMKSHIQAGLRLQYWLSLWDLQIIEAKHELNVERAIEKLYKLPSGCLKTHKIPQVPRQKSISNLSSPLEYSKANNIV